MHSRRREKMGGPAFEPGVTGELAWMHASMVESLIFFPLPPPFEWFRFAGSISVYLCAYVQWLAIQT